MIKLNNIEKSYRHGLSQTFVLRREGRLDPEERRRKFTQCLREHGVDASDIDRQPWGWFTFFSDPDGNGWVLQEVKTRPPGRDCGS